MKKQRQIRVEPVFGVLTQYLGLRKINTKGLSQANKVMHMSAIAYNLKKYLKFINKNAKSNRKVVAAQFSLNISIMCFKIKSFKQLEIWCF